jgi:histone deacetylase complex regulatory component SIN3
MAYMNKQKSIEDVYYEAKILFKGNEDLVKGFEDFLPKPSNEQGEDIGLADKMGKDEGQ